MKAQVIHQLFVSIGKNLCFAESITGGRLATSLIDHPGCSTYFLGGIIAYSNQVKIDLLGVTSETLKRYGAVSKEVVIEMAEGAKKKFAADFAVATSGIAGPSGGNEKKPVGTVFFAITGFGKTVSCSLALEGNRREIIEQVCEKCFEGLFEFVEHLQLFDKTILE